MKEDKPERLSATPFKSKAKRGQRLDSANGMYACTLAVFAIDPFLGDVLL
jgi:hypothetical protein